MRRFFGLGAVAAGHLPFEDSEKSGAV